MDEKAPSSFPDGESLDLDESAAKTTNDGPTPAEGSASKDGEGLALVAGKGAVEPVSLAERVAAGWRWASLPLAPLLVFLAVAVGLSVREPVDWPPSPELKRIETRAAYPRVAWTLDDVKRPALIDETAEERPRGAAVSAATGRHPMPSA